MITWLPVLNLKFNALIIVGQIMLMLIHLWTKEINNATTFVFSQVTINDGEKLGAMSCTCPRGAYKCSHIACIMIHIAMNVSSTDTECAWRKVIVMLLCNVTVNTYLFYELEYISLGRARMFILLWSITTNTLQITNISFNSYSH
jgi:hypothetical protein